MPAITITRKMLWDYYRVHHDEFTTDKQVQMQLIAVPFKAMLPPGVSRPTATDEAAAKKQARDLIARALAALRAGEDFGDVARKYSRGIKAKQGGLWPMMPANTFRETAVEQAAFRLAEGRYAGPIETGSGLYIVKAARVKPGRVVSFEQAQEQIAEKLRNRMYDELTQKYFRGLMEKAYVARSESFLELALARAAEERFGAGG